MEQLRRPAFRGSAGGGASSAYADVFGGPPRYSRSFAARLGDYDDVFGGLSSSCSIPVLDLPPAMEAHDPPRSSGLDYFEIFGGFEGGGVPTYEELVAEEERAAAAAEIQFSNGRSSNETELGQQRIEIPEFHPDHTNRNDVACLEKDQITSIANHLNDSSKQLNMPYHKTSQANMEDGTNETPNTTQPCVISGFSAYMNASQPSLSVRNDVPPNMVNGDFSLNTSSNDRISDQKHRRSFSSSSSAASSKCSGNDLRINEKQFATKDAPANTKLHSCSSSNHSTSSGDVCFSDFPYVFVSDINLSTQPVQVPPPSRPPPKLADDQEIAKMKVPANSKTELDKAISSKSIPSQKKYSVGNAPKRRAPQVPIRDSSFFFDVEVDASSAAAASAAAMKEAMEQAQARLKSAKESMERKWDNIPSRKKLGSNEGSKFEDAKKARSAQEIKMFNQEVDPKTFLKEKKKNEFTIEERYKARGAAKVAPDHEEKERLVVSYEQDRHMVQPNKFTSSQASSKLNDTTVEWKTDNQFYELVSNEGKFKVTTELSDKRSTDKVLKGAINVDEERENESSVSDLLCQLERKGISLKVHETRNREGKDKISNICDREFVEEKKELPNKIPNNFVWEENGNKLEEVSRFPQLVEDDTELCEVQETHAKEEEVNKPNIGDRVPACAETEMEMKRCIDASNFEAACENTENENKLEAAKEVCGNDGVEPSTDSVTCQPCETDKKPEIVNMIDTQVEEDEIKTPYASCMWDARDKVEPTPETNQHENYTEAREITAPECYQESRNLPKDTSLASEQHERINESRTEDASIFVKNDLKVEVTEEAKEAKKNLEELHSAERGIRRSEIETIEAVEWEYYEENKTDAQIELQQNAKVQTPTQASCELENSEVLTVAVRVHEKKENENTGEVHVHMNMKEKYNIFNVAQEVFRRVVNKDVEDIQVANFLGKNGKMSSRNTTDICPSVITKQTVPDMRIVEEKDKERRIQKELEKERKLEEEREREREREKDRIAVERATREARERSLSESRERAERIAVERVTAEARQRALAEAREKAEKASAEALEKSFAEKAAREARLRTERAAVERATAEARERAVERALAEKAAADARERAEKLNAASSRDKTRKGNETEEHSRSRSKGDVGSREKQDLPHDTQYTNQRQMDSYNHGEGESALRCKARLERHQRMVERAAKALAEKNMRDSLAQREQAERNRLAEMVDAEVRRWSTGKEGNLRALLSTLQYILGPESSWHPIPLTELITAAAVKKGYRKATLCVHPDKLQQRGANIHQKYICEKVFDLLKDAWNKFNSEER